MGLVDFTPILVSGDAEAGTDGFQGDFSELTAHPYGEQVGGVGRIQEAIDLPMNSGWSSCR